MLTTEQKEKLQEIDIKIQKLIQEKEQINPFANLKTLTNKAFGEEWSESYISSQCPNLKRCDKKGYDFLSTNLGRIEVKSSRLPCKQITFNQLHPGDCDYFLFVLYDTEEYDTQSYLISSSEICEQFHLTAQHDRNETASCFSMSLHATNQMILNNYSISWQELQERSGIFIE